MSFTDRQWQIELYDDTSDHVVIKKASQIGVSEYALVSMFWHAKIKKQDGIYILPRDKDAYNFTPRRIDPHLIPYGAVRSAVQHSHSTGQRKIGSDTKQQKTLFGTHWAVVGSNSVTNFYERPADVLIIDEYDKNDQGNLPYAFDRLGSSPAPYIYEFGNPTIPGFGIDQLYDRSTGNVWKVRCPRCNEWQSLDWFVNIVREVSMGKYELIDRKWSDLDRRDVNVYCRKCQRPIDRLGYGGWAERHPGRRIAGYQCDRIFGDGRRNLQVIGDMWNHWLEGQRTVAELIRFYNNVLGMAYEAEGSAITDGILSAAARDYDMPVSLPCEIDGFKYDGSVAGVDVGSVLHVHISGIRNIDGESIRRKLYIGTCDWDELHDLCRHYKVKRGCIDVMPETNLARQFCRAHPGWNMVRFVDTIKKRLWEKSKRSRELSCNRTEIFDVNYGYWRAGEIEIPRKWRSIDRGDFAPQMKAPHRIWDEDRERYAWDEGSKADHHHLASVYETLAFKTMGATDFGGMWI